MHKPLAALKDMAYPGRLILIGLDRAAEHVIVGYAITGRSASSQARKLRLQAGSIWTKPTDEEVLRQGKTDLLVYRAIAIGKGIAVSNGRQTEDIFKALRAEGEPEDILRNALESWSCEPDAPHFTPRLAGCVLPDAKACLSILRKESRASEERAFYPWVLEPGRAKMIATYAGRVENPLPSFDRAPLDTTIAAPDARSLAEALYDALAPAPSAPDYRVAVACVFAPLGDFEDFDAAIINRNER